MFFRRMTGNIQLIAVECNARVRLGVQKVAHFVYLLFCKGRPG
jgi:hypothetical protein